MDHSPIIKNVCRIKKKKKKLERNVTFILPKQKRMSYIPLLHLRVLTLGIVLILFVEWDPFLHFNF